MNNQQNSNKKNGDNNHSEQNGKNGTQTNGSQQYGEKQEATKKLNFFQQPFWKMHFKILLIVCPIGIALLINQTYNQAPPMENFVNYNQQVIISKQDILKGQEVFYQYALMQYGSMFGDGAQRGPDFTAESLHEIALSMTKFFQNKQPNKKAKTLVKETLKKNTYDEKTNTILIEEAHIVAFEELKQFYKVKFTEKTSNPESMQPQKYIRSSQETDLLSAFFFWGAWVCAAQRPGKEYSYTHNWPYDPITANKVTTESQIWSLVASLAMIALTGKLLFAYGRRNKFNNVSAIKEEDENPQKVQKLNLKNFLPTPSQSAIGKFLVVAMALFFLQTLVGLFVLLDFFRLRQIININIPVTITRSWHIQFAIQWIVTSWISASIFALTMITGKDNSNQKFLINVLFAILFVVVFGGFLGIFFGPKGLFGSYYYIFGHQGWEFLELGKFYQVLMLIGFFLWAFILWKGLRSISDKLPNFSIPKWLQYSVLIIGCLFAQGVFIRPTQSFVISDMWRWMVIHMYVECFFEVFTTVIVGYFMVMMDMIDMKSAEKSVNVAIVMFLGSGILGISHNLYWLAKPEATLAIGAVFSTLQVCPLIMIAISVHQYQKTKIVSEEMQDSYRFLMAVNFWNFVGAGVFGFIINLPNLNYYIHGTYLCVNHAHGALFGVYGNLSILAVLFVARHLAVSWNHSVVKFAFWSIQIGLSLMILLDMFPAGIYQLKQVMDKGMHYGRSQKFLVGDKFLFFQSLRFIGGLIVCFGGALPIFFVVLRTYFNSKKSVSDVSVQQSYLSIIDPTSENNSKKVNSLTLQEISKHNNKNDCWVVINGWVCDVTNFISQHPGGSSNIMQFAGGKNCDAQWNEIHEKDTIFKIGESLKIVGKLAA